MRFLWLAVLFATLPLAGCEAVEGIFKAGFFVGVIAVVLVVAGIGVLAARLRR